MVKLPVISGKKLLKILQKNGFRIVRQKGSHVFVETQKGDCGTVIPLHSNEDLGKGLLKSILNDLEINPEELVKILKK